ncbi:helix-turn-helix transcriptional regulator [Reinekea marinisedimentorum]|uniref:Putative DNA-binding transcriptional regulator YafY n=1 Tax=Reinekea marinisedimentorum TaxID=230495 RepID=A0A4V2UJ84_9GAMM|nr:WYL domain-containing protein [Reinekea marinisedimentorum]TCS39020.1 putative DNA-binding transcriptional regulator YafY [Reinekea marinisedimentorum]
MNDQTAWPMRWDLLSRYRLIEIVALWEGRLTTNHLCNSFGMGRQQASKDINNYNREVAPGNLIYDAHLKGYKPAPHFKPVVTTGTADEYLHVMSRSKDLSETYRGLDLAFAHSEILAIAPRTIKPEILRPVLQAIREKRRVEIEYSSLASPTPEVRVIAPHTLVCTPVRWHVRAYCEKNREFRDFVLSRFRNESGIMDETENTVDKDRDWNHFVDLKIKPDTRLTTEQQKIIAADYNMTRKVLKIHCRAAMVRYILKAYGIDHTKLEAQPEAQQIVVSNIAEVKRYI